MTQQQFEAKFNQRVTAAIKGMVFPAENIPDGFRDYLLLSMSVFTYHAVKCTLDEFEECAIYATVGGDLSLTSAFVSLQIARGVTAKDIGVDLPVYCQMNRLMDEMAIGVDVILKPIRDKINKELNEEFEKEQKQLRTNQLLHNGAKKKIHLPS